MAPTSISTPKAAAWSPAWASTELESHEPLRPPHLFPNFEHCINTQLHPTTELARADDRIKHFAAQKGRKPYQGGE